MTITYPNGTVLNAIVLAHEDCEIRAVAAGCDDVLVYTRVSDTWLSEDLEPVILGFAWQLGGTMSACSEDECICPKELAARLISTPAGAGERDEAVMDTLADINLTGQIYCLPTYVF